MTVRRLLRRYTAGGLAFCLAILVAAATGEAGAPADRAITGFDSSARGIEASFTRLNDLADTQPAVLRAAALAHLADAGPAHRAAVYALAITGQPGPADDALKRLLTSRDLDDRALAAGSLLSRGDRAGAPALVELLGSGRHLAYREPAERAWEFARSMLLLYTGQSFGLNRATTLRAAARTRDRWRAWARSAAPARAASPVRPGAVLAAAGGSSVSRSSDTVRVTVDIDVTPPPVYRDPVTRKVFDHTRQWQDAANRGWNAGFKRFRYHPAAGCPPGHRRDEGYRLELAVRMHALARGAAPAPGHHVVTYDGGVMRSNTTWPAGTQAGRYADSDSVYTGAGGGHWNPTRGLVSIVHEVGHLGLGLGDDYKDVARGGSTTSVALPGRAGTAMADGSRVDQNLANRVGKLAGSQVSLPPRCGQDKPVRHHPKQLRGLHRHYHGTTSQGRLVSVDIYPDGSLIYSMTVVIDCHDPVSGDYTFLGGVSTGGPAGRSADRRAELRSDNSFEDQYDGAPVGNSQFNRVAGHMSASAGHGETSAGDRPAGRTCTTADVTWHVKLTSSNP